MVQVREARNAIKLENRSGRVSQVPIDPTETIFAGDMVCLAAGNKLATKLTTAADAADFLGVCDHTNPQYTAGSLTTNYTKPYVNVVQSGLVEMIAGAIETLDPWQAVEMVTDAQHVKSSTTAANVVGIVDPGWAGPTGKAVIVGDYVKFWLKVPAMLQVWGPRVEAETFIT
jgi:hypothetical protein